MLAFLVLKSYQAARCFTIDLTSVIEHDRHRSIIDWNEMVQAWQTFCIIDLSNFKQSKVTLITKIP